MILKCAHCGCIFEAHRRKRRFCSKHCANAARYARKVAHAEAVGKELGLTGKEVLARVSMGFMSVPGLNPGNTHPPTWLKSVKSYAQIRAENRKRRNVAGWRGQPVLGGGGGGSLQKFMEVAHD